MGEDGGNYGDLKRTLAHHDRELGALNNRIGHVEKTLTDHGSILSEIRQAVTKQDARPQFNFHQSVSTVLHMAVLFGMMVTGIIWVTTGQFGGIVAEQKSLNAELRARIEKHDATLDRLAERIGWTASTAPPSPATKLRPTRD